jgi:hypothetical protein
MRDAPTSKKAVAADGSSFASKTDASAFSEKMKPPCGFLRRSVVGSLKGF